MSGCRPVNRWRAGDAGREFAARVREIAAVAGWTQPTTKQGLLDQGYFASVKYHNLYVVISYVWSISIGECVNDHDLTIIIVLLTCFAFRYIDICFLMR